MVGLILNDIDVAENQRRWRWPLIPGIMTTAQQDLEMVLRTEHAIARRLVRKEAQVTTSIHDAIGVLSERDALRVLALVVDYDGDLPDSVSSREIEQRIGEAASDAGQDGRPASAGELARAALHYLAGTPERAGVIDRALAIPADNSRFDLVTLGVGALIVVALKTEVKLTRSEEGRWSLLVHKQPMGDSALGSLVGRLLAYYRELNR